MPLSELRRFAALIRQGPGNEDERLRILDEHRTRADAQITALEHARDIITWKTEVYQQHLQHGEAEGLWDPTTPGRS